MIAERHYISGQCITQAQHELIPLRRGHLAAEQRRAMRPTRDGIDGQQGNRLTPIPRVDRIRSSSALKKVRDKAALSLPVARA
jgi:hypothetical protein